MESEPAAIEASTAEPVGLPKGRFDVVPDVAGIRPVLAEAQVEVLRGYGTEHDVPEGHILFAAGDATYDLIVVLEGRVAVVENFGQPDEIVVAAYQEREFPGEMGMFTGQRAYLTAVVTSAGRVLRVPVDRVRVVMAQEPNLSELILRAFLLRHDVLTRRGTGLTLIGSRFDADTRRLLEVLARNRLSSKWLELESSPDAEALLRELAVPLDDLPILMVPGGELLRNPSSRELLDALGMIGARSEDQAPECCDLLVVGGGPAGLAAAVYGASEGMTTTLAEDLALGGQAGTSSRIENYLGFPAGLSGEELAARAELQAEKFGARIRLGARAIGLTSDAGSHEVRFDGGDVVRAKAVIIATGARYNRLPLDRLGEFEGTGVFYAATQMEATGCIGEPVVVVGGGNSAGQAALYLARTCAQVHIVIRRESLASSMSRYLIEQIDRHPLIKVSPFTEVVSLVGQDALEGVALRDNQLQTNSILPVRGLFVFIGARPNTEWLGGQLAQDDHGFLYTGADVPMSCLEDSDHAPLFLETNRPGIFCVGDVRARSVKRAATAIGEGSMAVRLVFDRLETTGLAVADPPRVDA